MIILFKLVDKQERYNNFNVFAQIGSDMQKWSIQQKY